MEDDILKLQELLKRAYEKLADCDDTFAGSDSWKSEEQQKLLNDIADALSIEEKLIFVIVLCNFGNTCTKVLPTVINNFHRLF